MHGHVHPTKVLPGHRRDLAGRRQRSVFFHGHELRTRVEAFRSGLQQRHRRGRVFREGGERNGPVRQSHFRARQGGVAAAGGAGGSPVTLVLPGDVRGVDTRAGTGDQFQVDGLASNVEFGQQVANGLRRADLALEHVQQLGVTRADAESGIHHAHQRHWVGGYLNQHGVTCGKRLLGGVQEPHALAGTAHPIVRFVHHSTGLVCHPTVYRAEQRDAQRHGGNVCGFSGKFTKDRLNSAGVTGAFDVKQSSKLVFRFQHLHQFHHGLAGATHGGHAGTRVHGRFDACVFGVFLDESVQFIHGKLHHGHGTQLIFRQRLLALPHQSGTMAGHPHRVLSTQTTGRVGCGNLAHRHAHHGTGCRPKRCQQVRQGNLDRGNARLRGFRVVGLGIIRDEFHQRPPGLELNELVQFLKPGLKQRRHGH